MLHIIVKQPHIWFSTFLAETGVPPYGDWGCYYYCVNKGVNPLIGANGHEVYATTRFCTNRLNLCKLPSPPSLEHVPAGTLFLIPRGRFARFRQKWG